MKVIVICLMLMLVLGACESSPDSPPGEKAASSSNAVLTSSEQKIVVDRYRKGSFPPQFFNFRDFEVTIDKAMSNQILKQKVSHEKLRKVYASCFAGNYYPEGKLALGLCLYKGKPILLMLDFSQETQTLLPGTQMIYYKLPEELSNRSRIMNIYDAKFQIIDPINQYSLDVWFDGKARTTAPMGDLYKSALHKVSANVPLEHYHMLLGYIDRANNPFALIRDDVNNVYLLGMSKALSDKHVQVIGNYGDWVTMSGYSETINRDTREQRELIYLLQINQQKQLMRKISLAENKVIYQKSISDLGIEGEIRKVIKNPDHPSLLILVEHTDRNMIYTIQEDFAAIEKREVAKKTTDLWTFTGKGQTMKAVIFQPYSEEPFAVVSKRIDPNIPDDLPHDLIKSLVTEAANRYFHTKEGGAPPNAKCDDRIITVNGKGGYQFFCEPLDTMDKLKAYLSEVFTDEIVDQLIAELNLVIVDNKIAMQTLGVVGGSDWEHATFKMTKREGNFHSYECTVPIAGSDDSELRKVVLLKDPKNGWKVASDPSQLK